MGRFIFDPLTSEPTILATERAKRTDQTGVVSQGTVSGNVCFFCKGNEHQTPPTLYQDTEDWGVRVVKNKYPIIDDHEVVIHSPHHDKDLEDLDHDQVVRIIRAFLNRLHFYTSQEKEVFIFNNRGKKAGASLNHPHSQIIALKGFPGILQNERAWSIKYYDEKNTCFWCDEVKEVLADRSRVVLETSHYVVLVPKACRWSYEVRIIPKNHKPNFGYIDESEINGFAGVLQKVIQAYGNAFNYPDRNFWIHTERYDPYHWHVGFLPHLKVFGAVELGAGIWVSDKATPEDAAKLLRENI
ncbi:DUF4931 domain-containing protein [candidate division WWE3 bacterium]|nr:DUF4931 domain-containing protein [candidate division WWE3 bacterium]